MISDMTSSEKVISAIRKQMKQTIEIRPESLLAEELRLDSMSLVELTMYMHSEYGIDLGRKAVELKIVPKTVSDIIALVEVV